MQGGKERKGSNKVSKSLQANSFPNRGSIGGVPKQANVSSDFCEEISARQIQELSARFQTLSYHWIIWRKKEISTSQSCVILKFYAKGLNWSIYQ
ncbi:microtubule-associated protein RP/EB family member 1A-like [Iris pallida]|uniref:Microtubule-associated protein RP/EB family member 1A-like n=1 Tax=Iris pallida TaxID=29817 RepID=A0AAX6DJC8_IRIPA|nr:microtubule-associated protein RP/EB family member 1A-like [Iris pallida]